MQIDSPVSEKKGGSEVTEEEIEKFIYGTVKAKILLLELQEANNRIKEMIEPSLNSFSDNKKVLLKKYLKGESVLHIATTSWQDISPADVIDLEIELAEKISEVKKISTNTAQNILSAINRYHDEPFKN